MKILVDTSVWIDFFNGVSSAPQAALRKLLEEEEDVCISAYILTETLQGFNHDRELKNPAASSVF
ncbi:MAG: PIN domain-containing protein [Deltaproteobacteria bacterium]|nr:PIN domain-containing protein [Deltaproteobacteria bacterium]